MRNWNAQLIRETIHPRLALNKIRGGSRFPRRKSDEASSKGLLKSRSLSFVLLRGTKDEMHSRRTILLILDGWPTTAAEWATNQSAKPGKRTRPEIDVSKWDHISRACNEWTVNCDRQTSRQLIRWLSPKNNNGGSELRRSLTTAPYLTPKDLDMCTYSSSHIQTFQSDSPRFPFLSWPWKVRKSWRIHVLPNLIRDRSVWCVNSGDREEGWEEGSSELRVLWWRKEGRGRDGRMDGRKGCEGSLRSMNSGNFPHRGSPSTIKIRDKCWALRNFKKATNYEFENIPILRQILCSCSLKISAFPKNTITIGTLIEGKDSFLHGSASDPRWEGGGNVAFKNEMDRKMDG